MDNQNQKTGRVTTEYKGAYKVKNDDGEFLAKVTGKHMFSASSREDFPAVGDFVVIDELPEAQAVIREILPRKTIIKRKAVGGSDVQIIATNIDVAFVVESVSRDWSLNRFERYFSIARDGGIEPAIIINKIDLISKDELDKKLAEIKNRFPDTDVFAVSVASGEGLDELIEYIKKDKTYCFLGSSGVGKSSLINKLIGNDLIKTEDISSYSDRGKHITTARQMYFLKNGGIVIDNPGMREVGMANVAQGINDLFAQITELAQMCKYKDCTHTHESGCAVLMAVESGEVDREKYLNYLDLKKETEFYEMSELERREKDRDFGKFIKNTKKSLKQYGHKNF
ncbi:MAG TPA: ribosome small subunit-dependent GTPase A [Candidatus Staskawiczbacteria bacterium]|nr:ribosome small subunit-dependent GTPase A [Candidatus Staskawiczbacteria bacterium]